jgi:antitoxin (DNA-binding transcriptional repressor) of toxin-antitoxin stability system
MRTVGLRELKNSLSEYVRCVRKGETLLVTDRGEVVAQMGPPQPSNVDRTIHPGLLELARRGLLRLPTRKNDPSLYRRKRGILKPEEIAELLDWTRGER